MNLKDFLTPGGIIRLGRRKVIIESPFHGETKEDIAANVAYARSCCAHSFGQGEDPFASHLFYPQFLLDSDPELRQLGIALGYDKWHTADEVVFYVDRGFSPGMKNALVKAASEKKLFSIRTLPVANNRDVQPKA